ncbi:putative dsRNA-binding protein [Deinococcus fonticola]|uniref:putative dsRNA-binding protein n=1 Tax=Deinococcus fonticola TaxID=2528713 RepID=UPI0010755201|nr:putative dsRNA-binding protein [Deinococcus fonticola]
MTANNSKGDLIARAVTLGLDTPTFDAEASGPPHNRSFHAVVRIGHQVLGQGEGRTKREAERAAAEQALQALQEPSASAPSETSPSPAATWPIYAPVLAQSVEAALEFAEEDDTLEDVQVAAARFYRDLLSDLGHSPE